MLDRDVWRAVVNSMKATTVDRCESGRRAGRGKAGATATRQRVDAGGVAFEKHL